MHPKNWKIWTKNEGRPPPSSSNVPTPPSPFYLTKNKSHQLLINLKFFSNTFKKLQGRSFGYMEGQIRVQGVKNIHKGWRGTGVKNFRGPRLPTWIFITFIYHKCSFTWAKNNLCHFIWNLEKVFFKSNHQNIVWAKK